MYYTALNFTYESLPSYVPLLYLRNVPVYIYYTWKKYLISEFF